MRRHVRVAAFVLVLSAGTVLLAPILYQFAAVHEIVIGAAPIAGPAAILVLLDALDEEDNSVGVRTILALGKKGCAVPCLIDSLSGGRPDIRTKAALGLGALNAREAIPLLIEAVRAETDKPVRLAALLALQMMVDRGFDLRVPGSAARSRRRVARGSRVWLGQIRR